MTWARAILTLLLTAAVLLLQGYGPGIDPCGPGMAVAAIQPGIDGTGSPSASCSRHHPGGVPVQHDRQHCATSPTCTPTPAIPVVGPMLAGLASHRAPVVLASVTAESRSTRPDAPPPRYIGL